jgi:tetratricopeptide (TPR) repeat protein
MEKESERRYASAAEFAEDLRQYLQHGLITARRAGIARRTWKSMRRHPVASIGTAAVIILALAAGTIWWATTARSHEMATRILSDARLDYREGDYNGALERAGEALAIDPQLPGARFLRAQALMDLRRGQEAVTEAKSLLERNPDDWIAHMVLAQAALGIKSAQFPELSAEEHIRALEEYAPESADAYYLRSLIDWQQDVRGALELLDRALELEPGHVDALAQRIDLYEDLKDYPAALADASSLIIARPRSPVGYVGKAWIQFRMHDIDRAMETINRAIELSPDNALAYSWRSTIFVSLGQRDEAIADLERAIDLQPDNSRWYTQRAGIYRAKAEYEAAETDARRAIELDANNLQAYRELTNTYPGLGDRNSTRALMDELLAVVEGWVDDDARAEARRLASDVFLYLGETDLALEQADLAVEADPDRPYAFIQRAKVKRRTDGASAAENDCEQAAAIELDNPELLFERSSSLAGDPCYRDDLAIADMNLAVELSPNWADAYALRGGLHNVERRFEESLLDLNRTVELAPAWGDAYFQRAWAYMHMERFEKALADYEECERLRIKGASHSNAWRMHAEALFLLGRDEEALETMDKIVESLPAAAYGHVQLANLLFWMGRIREAVAALDQAIELEPAAPLSYERRSRYQAFLPGGCERAAADLERYDELAQDNVNRWSNAAWVRSAFLGRACPEQADYALALSLARRAAESDPSSGWYQEVLGVALFRNGFYREAYEALLRRLGDDPPNLNDVDTLFSLAMVAWKVDRRAEARAYYDRGLERMEFLRHSRDPYAIACQKEAAEVLGIKD